MMPAPDFDMMYEDGVLDEVISLCRDSDLIGISLMTNYFHIAVQITGKIKSQLDTPIIWGGVHPTIRPEESLQFADIVCIGEGEEGMLELVAKLDGGDDYSDTAGLWFNVNGKTIKNPLRPLIQNLDIYPFPDYSMDDHYVLLDGHLKPLTHKMTKSFLVRPLARNLPKKILKRGSGSIISNKIFYQTMAGRGCPHKCSYCINDTMRNMYKGQRYLRWNSTAHTINELLWVKEHMPYIDLIWISDDVFFARSLKDIEEFCREYKKKITLPFFCLTSPLVVTEEKMALLVDAGLICVQMGIESASKRTQELYNRKNMSNERVMKAVRIVNKYKDRILPPIYDFIVDVPYETDEDRIENLRFISELPKPFRIQLFSLVLYPGTKLYQRAKEDGFIQDEKKLIYEKDFSIRDIDYLTLLVRVSDKLPGVLLRFFISSPIVDILNSELMKPLFRRLYICLRTIHERFIFPKN
jgi:radical SAM superfamily enzyme YgiQ (UPF0313 family)